MTSVDALPVLEAPIKERSEQQTSEAAEQPAAAGAAGGARRTPYPQALRAQVESARADDRPKSDLPAGAAGGPGEKPASRRSGSLTAFTPTSRSASPSHFDVKVRQAGSRQLEVRGSTASARLADVRRSRTALIMGLKCKSLFISRDTAREPVALQHDDEVMDLAFNPAGTQLLAGGEDCAVVLWDVSGGTEVFKAKPEAPVKAVAFSPSGCYVAAADANSVVTVWKASNGEEVGRAEVEGDVLSLTMSASRREVLAVGTTEKTVTLFSVPGMESITELAHDGQARSLTFSPDGTLLAGGGGVDDKHGLMTKKSKYNKMKTVIWQLAADGNSASHVAAVEFDDIVHATVFAPGGNLLAVGGENCEVAVLLVDRGFERATSLQCAAGVRCLAWSPDNRFLASGGEDMQISIWDVVDEVLALQLPKARDWYCGLAFSTDGLWLASCGFGTREVLLHPVTTSEERLASRPSSRAPSEADEAEAPSLDGDEDAHDGADHEPRRLSSSPAGPQSLAVTMSVPASVETGDQVQGFMLKVEQVGSGDERRPQGRDARSDKALMLGVPLGQTRPALSTSRQAVELKHTDEVMGLSFSPDGRFVATGGEDASLVIWDAADGSKAAGAKLDDPISSLAYSPSGLYVAVATTGSSLVLWGTAEKCEVGSKEFDAPVLTVAIGKSELLAAGTADKGVSLLSLPNMQEIACLQHDDIGTLRCLSFSPCGGMLTGGGGIDDMHGLMTNKSQRNDMKIVVWRVAAAAQDCKYMGSISFPDIVHAAAFSPTGTLLAVGGEDRVISMLLVDRDFESVSQFVCVAGVRCLGWSPDSRFLASGGEDMQVTIWDVLSEQMVFQTPKATDWLCCVSFSPDGRWLASCGFGHNEATLHPVEDEKHE